EKGSKQIQPPLLILEDKLTKFVVFVIIPVFAFVNSGIIITSNFITVVSSPIALGTILGLVIGKPLGICLFSWLSIKTKLAKSYEGINWKHIVGVSFLGGVGFTMSIFIASLSFSSLEFLNAAKTGILIASVISGIIGLTILYLASKKTEGAEISI
ncbi:MAG: Na+/H+ antiporter NhaA, partial [Candidatus Heimdallarchaeaceae archaeon]